MYENEIVPEEFGLGFSITQNSEKDKQNGTYLFGMGNWSNSSQTWADILFYLIRRNKGHLFNSPAVYDINLVDNLMNYCNTEFMYSKNKTILYLVKHNINPCSMYCFNEVSGVVEELEENEMFDENKIDSHIKSKYISKIIEIMKKARNIESAYRDFEILIEELEEDINTSYIDYGFVKKR